MRGNKKGGKKQQQAAAVMEGLLHTLHTTTALLSETT